MAHESDFEYVTDSDDDNRGLNFDSLPIKNAVPINCGKNRNSQLIPARTINYKYPCVICHKPCKKNIHDSISCFYCDEWVHQTCSELTLNQFKVFCSPGHENDLYFCRNCRFECTSPEQIPGTALNNVGDIIEDVDNFTANSVFQNKEDINISEYYTVDEVNDLEIYKTPDDIVIVHINSVSLDKNYDSIKILLERMKPKPSIIFLSETKIPLSPSEIELNKIIFEGFHKPMLNNSPTKAGGTAIYVSETLSYNERPDLKFDFPECETCFVEVETNSCQNPIFGAMYRHPRPNEQAFTSHLEEFLEGFAVRGIKLTIMGDFNINLNQNNIVSREYIKSLHSLGFSALINQPTRYYTVEGSNYVGCSTLDHLITNSSETFSNVGILISDVSDHLPLFASMKLKNSKSNSFKNTYRRSFSDKKKEKFVKCLENHLENFDFSLDSNSLMDNFLLAMNNTINEVCPLKKVSRKQAQLLLNPWMTEEILKEIHIKDNLHKIYIKHRNKNSDDHKQWKKQRNKVNRLLTAAKNKDTENDCVKAKGNSAKMWKAINKATNQKPKSNVTPDFVRIRSPAGDLKKNKM